MGFSTIKFAKIENKLDKKLITQIFQGVKKYGMRGRRPYRRGFWKPEIHKGGLVFRFYKDIKNTSHILDETNKTLVEGGYLDGELKLIVIFKNGYLAYENPRIGRSSSEEIFDLIKKVWELNISKEEILEITEINKFPYKSLKNFYKEANEISLLRLSDIGQTKPNPHWPEELMKEIVQEVGRNSATVEFRTGKKEGKKKTKNLKKTKAITEGFLPISKPLRIRGRIEENETFDIRLSGILSISLPNEEGAKTQKFINFCKKVIDGFIK